MPRPFLYDMAKMDLVDTEVPKSYPSASTAMCVQNRGASATTLVPSCMQPPSATTFAIRCSQGEDLGIEAVNR